MAEKELRGLIQVYKGRGKGKTTAAFGLALRAVGQGLKVLIVQFMKSTDFITGEMKGAKRLEPELKVIQFGDSGIWGLGVPKRKYTDKAKKASIEALNFAKEQLSVGWDIIILDEVGIAMHLDLLEESSVLDLIETKPKDLELVLTGLEMPERIVKVADLVSEITDVKHPYYHGIEARKGIEY
ncbi:MAG: cob(I)yrinic acid a,c-diamide adenosyltransferase [Actinobacteria bacterium]|nr:MAG: cob(I)yrinic acid a,c-diamide adenosyltransferase [Actinomycetota bacterium]